MSLAPLAPAFLMGLLGSVHCVGMCGPIVLASTQRHDRLSELATHQTLYHLGKALAYATLGLGAAALVGFIGDALGAYLSSAQRILSIGLGLLLIVLGVGLLSGARWLEGYGLINRIPGFRSALRALIRERYLGATFGLGFLNGFLPCGLVYAALALAAATGSALMGGAVMLAFAAGTVPALVLVGTLGHAVRPAWQTRLHRAAGILLIIAGLPTILRATPLWHTLMHLLHG